MMYNELTLLHFETATNAGVLTGTGIRRGAAGSPALGTWVQFDVQLETQAGGAGSGTLRAVRFQAFGCPHVIAISDWVAEQAVGMPALPALPAGVAELRARFALPTDKLGRLLIIEDAWIAALSPPPHY